MKKAKLLWKFILTMLIIPVLGLFVVFLELLVFLINIIVNFDFTWKKLDNFDGVIEEWKQAIKYFKRKWNDD